MASSSAKSWRRSTVTPRSAEPSRSLITAAGYAAIVLIGLPAGVLVQRFALRRLQVTLDLVRAAAVLTVPLAPSTGQPSFF